MKKICSNCGATMVEYKHGMAKGLARILARIAIDLKGVPGEVLFGDYVNGNKMAHTPLSNLHKLHYWGLLDKVVRPDGKGGGWYFTEKGLAFVTGEIKIAKNVWTYRSKFVRFDGPDIGISEVTGGWKYRPQYAKEAVPHAERN